MRGILKSGAVAFDNRCARVYTAPLNKRATDASALPTGRASFASVGDPNANFAVQRYAFFLICANFGAWKSQNYEIFGAERGVRRCFCRDQIPTQGTKKSGKYYLPVKEERGKREQGGGEN